MEYLGRTEKQFNLRRQTEKLATQLNIEYIFERPEEKILLQKPKFGSKKRRKSEK